MAKKVTKKQTTKSKVVKKTKSKKTPSEKSIESGSLSIMILAIVGIILLVYFGTSTEVSVDVKVGDKNTKQLESTEQLIEDNTITISGKTYNSSQEAYSVLKAIPQTRQTNEETGFVESYKMESYK